ncbi:hypothetical protein ACFQ5J_11105 [Lacticaseibacillus baoqingensis]|uniref:Uncharacterized protein n=1 Tax=Lacticaseibacillus baoqingensis TaxID=2486013 RepID=A0ABW4EAI8_9LACO|nr:hypothetical protein [Lacticaseibacillus baoqingensis]
MVNAELLFPEWEGLKPQRRQFIFEQLTRYFLSPLLAVDQLKPVTVDYFGQTLNTFDALIGGEWLRFVPGRREVSLGVDRHEPVIAELLAQLPPAALSPKRVVAMPPMLVARQAVPVNEEVIGQVNLLTQVFKGNHFAYVPYKPAVLSLLRPTVTSVDPEAQPTWAPVLASGKVVLRQASAHHYQVRLRHDWDQAGLAKALGGFGFSLPTEDQYEYLQGGGFDQLFTWGNHLPKTLPAYLPNRFGLTIPTQTSTPELVAEAVAKRGAGLLGWSPYYRAAENVPFAAHTYRKVAVISLD